MNRSLLANWTSILHQKLNCFRSVVAQPFCWKKSTNVSGHLACVGIIFFVLSFQWSTWTLRSWDLSFSTPIYSDATSCSIFEVPTYDLWRSYPCSLKLHVLIFHFYIDSLHLVGPVHQQRNRAVLMKALRGIWPVSLQFDPWVKIFKNAYSPVHVFLAATKVKS